jgi:glycosyltransferase involved in cell wall biosynthesis
MANQTRQLARLLQAEGLAAHVVQTNRPYRPAWIGGVPWLRAVLRLVPYLVRLWRAAGTASVFHVMANSGWSWHLFAAPAVWIARLRGAKVIINYRGGEAERFFDSSFAWVAPTLRAADLIVVPSGFLHSVFARYGLVTRVIPNIVDLSRFHPIAELRSHAPPVAPHIVVTRNLEAIYDIPTVLRAFARLRSALPDSRLTIAGSGPALAALQLLACRLGIEDAVEFPGRLDEDSIAELYRSAAVSLNPSLVDNMPNSILEALASGVPVVSTRVGGVPYMVEHDVSALLVPPGDPDAMAEVVLRLLGDACLRQRLVDNGRQLVRDFDWPRVRPQWFAAYARRMRKPAHATAKRGGS